MFVRRAAVLQQTASGCHHAAVCYLTSCNVALLCCCTAPTMDCTLQDSKCDTRAPGCHCCRRYQRADSTCAHGRRVFGAATATRPSHSPVLDSATLVKLRGNVQPAGLRLHRTAGTKCLREVAVFNNLPADLILGANYILSGYMQLSMEGSKVDLRSPTSWAPLTESQRSEPSGKKTLPSVFEQHSTLFADNNAQLHGTDLLEHRITTANPPLYAYHCDGTLNAKGLSLPNKYARC